VLILLKFKSMIAKNLIKKTVYKLRSYFLKSFPLSLLLDIPPNNVLKKQSEVDEAIRIAKQIGLPLHPDRPKNWDSLAAVSFFLNYCQNKASNILDAGGEYYSALLPQLAFLGYRNLTCINLSFKRPLKFGKILFENADLTKTKYNEHYFDGISCLSVIEHGVNIDDYFREMSRILKINGILITSTDYWDTPIEVGNKISYDFPVKIFNSSEIINFVSIAENYGFQPLGALDLFCNEKVIECQSLKYTFLYFLLQKVK